MSNWNWNCPWVTSHDANRLQTWGHDLALSRDLVTSASRDVRQRCDESHGIRRGGCRHPNNVMNLVPSAAQATGNFHHYSVSGHRSRLIISSSLQGCGTIQLHQLLVRIGACRNTNSQSYAENGLLFAVAVPSNLFIGMPCLGSVFQARLVVFMRLMRHVLGGLAPNNGSTPAAVISLGA